MKCAVLGSPIAHSLSPAMHRAAYAELGLDWTYEAVDVALAIGLATVGWL
jgi:shikimate dehydrogenase